MEKKKLKCTRYVIRTQLVQLASWRKWDPRYSHPRQQINRVGPGWGESELVSSKSAAVPSITPLSVIIIHYLGQFLAFCPKRGL